MAAIALKAMGRFAHEALALDPRTNYVYETEDSGSSGFYRFIPARGHDFRTGSPADAGDRGMAAV